MLSAKKAKDMLNRMNKREVAVDKIKMKIDNIKLKIFAYRVTKFITKGVKKTVKKRENEMYVFFLQPYNKEKNCMVTCMGMVYEIKNPKLLSPYNPYAYFHNVILARMKSKLGYSYIEVGNMNDRYQQRQQFQIRISW